MTPSIFRNLPQELYRYIYDFDDTYRNVFNSSGFVNELGNYIYKKQYKLVHQLIHEINQFRNEYYMDMASDTDDAPFMPPQIQYKIILRTHHKNSKIIQFNLIPINPLPDEGDCIYGYICNAKYTHFISNINEIVELKIKTTKPESSLSLYYYVIGENPYEECLY